MKTSAVVFKAPRSVYISLTRFSHWSQCMTSHWTTVCWSCQYTCRQKYIWPFKGNKDSSWMQMATANGCCQWLLPMAVTVGYQRKVQDCFLPSSLPRTCQKCLTQAVQGPWNGIVLIILHLWPCVRLTNLHLSVTWYGYVSYHGAAWNLPFSNIYLGRNSYDCIHDNWLNMIGLGP